RILDRADVAEEVVEVRSAQSHRLRPNDDLAGAGIARLRHVDDLHRPAGVSHGGAHGRIESRHGARRNAACAVGAARSRERPTPALTDFPALAISGEPQWAWPLGGELTCGEDVIE